MYLDTNVIIYISDLCLQKLEFFFAKVVFKVIPVEGRRGE